MLLETSRRYNPAIESITFLKDFSYNKEDFAKAGTEWNYVKYMLGLNSPDVYNNEEHYVVLLRK